MTYFQRLVANTFTFIILALLLPNMIHLSSVWMGVVAAFVLSILNMFVKPILTILSLPFTLLTFGLFSFIVNAAILQMTSVFVGESNFSFSSFGSAVFVAVVISLVNTIVSERNLNKYYS